ncbi:MAG TPA: alginate export family protein [Candidatus Hydrogenedentes bacterium]|nr:alginate export family protein [Candidatus Hydrogenedentota bacterium]HOL77247.1 alginate export family protein [Candidatus Hydrogenedentota bacterium]HPO86537.1 alginate export family protein [Candidatus Hydrogenedentota bacterium]
MRERKQEYCGSTFTILFATLCSVCFSNSLGEIKTIEIGGKIEIYGAWYSGLYDPNGASVRIPSFWLWGRPIGPFGTISSIQADDRTSLSFLEQRTRLNIQTLFTDELLLFTEIDSTNVWGDGFPSDYLTGVDRRRETGGEIEVFQSFIEISKLWGLPLNLRIGRQSMEFGSGWLVGADPGPDPFIGFSFDAIRATYKSDLITVDTWWSKLFESENQEEDGDTDFMGIYMTFSRKPEMDHSFTFDLDLYWMFFRDARALSDTNSTALFKKLEDLLGLDDYDPTTLHTFGVRIAGTLNAWDWELEAARQTGEADAAGFLFHPLGGVYGDNSATFSDWAGHAQVGYTLNSDWNPRIYIGGAYYGGEDCRTVTLGQWLNPFFKPRASISFNRLFSVWREDNFIDAGEMSNFWKAYGGISTSVSEKLELGAEVMYFEAVEGFRPPISLGIGKWQIPLLPQLPFLTSSPDKSLGWETILWASYNYSEDINFSVGWSRFFIGDAISNGVVFTDQNGLANIGGINKKTADYLYFQTTVTF